MSDPLKLLKEKEHVPVASKSVIYRYRLIDASHTKPLAYVDFECRAAAKFIHVGVQAGHFVVWAVVEPDALIVRRRIWIVGTGVPIPQDATDFIETIHTIAVPSENIVIANRPQQQEFVWHFFAGEEYADG